MCTLLCCVAVSAMAERLANHFACYRPASDLFIQLLDMDKVEDAKFMLAVSMSVWMFKEERVCFPKLQVSDASHRCSFMIGYSDFLSHFMSFSCPYGLCVVHRG